MVPGHRLYVVAMTLTPAAGNATAEQQTCLTGNRVGVEIGEHLVGGDIEVPGDGNGGHGVKPGRNCS